MARPSTHNDPVKLTLYVDRSTREALFSAAASMSMSVSGLVTMFANDLPKRHKEPPQKS